MGSRTVDRLDSEIETLSCKQTKKRHAKIEGPRVYYSKRESARELKDPAIGEASHYLIHIS